MTDRQAKQLDLVASAKMVGSVMDQIALALGEEFAREFNRNVTERFRQTAGLMENLNTVFFAGVGIPRQFLMLDTVTTINEIRDVQEVIVRSRAAIDRPRLVFKGQGDRPRISKAWRHQVLPGAVQNLGAVQFSGI